MLTLLKFEAKWCAPCRGFKKVWEKVVPEFPGMSPQSVDADDRGDLVAQYEVRSLPTVVAVRGDTVVDRWSGAVSEDVLREKLTKLL